MPFGFPWWEHLQPDKRGVRRSNLSDRGAILSVSLAGVTRCLDMCSASVLLGLAAGVYTYYAAKSHSAEISKAIENALTNQRDTIPAEALPFVFACAQLVPAFLAFCIVTAAASLVRALFGSCAAGAGGAVPFGLPVRDLQGRLVGVGAASLTTEYVEMPSGARGQWVDPLCGCFNDFKVLLAGLCCPCVLIGQSYERVKRRQGACLVIVGCFAAASAFVMSMQQACPQPEVTCTEKAGHLSCQTQQPSTRPSPVCELANGVSSLSWLFLVALLMLVRYQASGVVPRNAITCPPAFLARAPHFPLARVHACSRAAARRKGCALSLTALARRFPSPLPARLPYRCLCTTRVPLVLLSYSSRAPLALPLVLLSYSLALPLALPLAGPRGLPHPCELLRRLRRLLLHLLLPTVHGLPGDAPLGRPRAHALHAHLLHGRNHRRLRLESARGQRSRD